MKKKLGPFTFVIDRPKGTVKEWPGGKKFRYPCDYGYWPKIKGEDGEGLDAFVGDDEAGHLESFQKLHPDGTPDETKFLLGVDDRQRETIYGLYKNEVNARRVYRDWEEVEGAIEKFQTKMHKTSAHAHKWSVGYLPGYGYRRCSCGAVEDVDPDGKTRPAGAKDKAAVTRWHEKSAAYRFGVKLAMSLDWVPTSIGGRVQTPSQIVQSSWSTPALAGTQENIKLLQLAQDPYGTGTPTPVHHRHRRHHG